MNSEQSNTPRLLKVHGEWMDIAAWLDLQLEEDMYDDELA